MHSRYDAKRCFEVQKINQSEMVNHISELKILAGYQLESIFKMIDENQIKHITPTHVLANYQPSSIIHISKEYRVIKNYIELCSAYYVYMCLKNGNINPANILKNTDNQPLINPRPLSAEEIMGYSSMQFCFRIPCNQTHNQTHNQTS